MKVEAHPSPNFNDRKHPVDMLVFHYTGMETGQEALDRMCDPAAEVSAHYMIWEDGTKTTWKVGEPQVHYVMDKEHEGFNYSDEEMIFLMLDVKKSTQVEV